MTETLNILNDNKNDNKNENQNHGGNNHNQISDDDTVGNTSYDDYDVYNGDPKDNHQDDHDPPEGGDHNPEYEEHEDDNVDEPGGNGRDANDIEQGEEDTGASRRRNRRSMHRSLSGTNNKDALNGAYWN